MYMTKIRNYKRPYIYIYLYYYCSFVVVKGKTQHFQGFKSVTKTATIIFFL